MMTKFFDVIIALISESTFHPMSLYIIIWYFLEQMNAIIALNAFNFTILVAYISLSEALLFPYIIQWKLIATGNILEQFQVQIKLCKEVTSGSCNGGNCLCASCNSLSSKWFRDIFCRSLLIIIWNLKDS